MNTQRAADPDRVDQMVALGVGGVGVDEDAEAPMVQHQPGDERGEDFGGEGDLVHGLLVRADRLVAPVAEAHAKTLADALAQPFGMPALRLIAVIDVGVIAGDFRKRSRIVRPGFVHRAAPLPDGSGRSCGTLGGCSFHGNGEPLYRLFSVGLLGA